MHSQCTLIVVILFCFRSRLPEVDDFFKLIYGIFSHKINACSVFAPQRISVLHVLVWLHAKDADVTSLPKCWWNCRIVFSHFCLKSSDDPFLNHYIQLILHIHANTYATLEVIEAVSPSSKVIMWVTDPSVNDIHIYAISRIWKFTCKMKWKRKGARWTFLRIKINSTRYWKWSRFEPPIHGLWVELSRPIEQLAYQRDFCCSTAISVF